MALDSGSLGSGFAAVFRSKPASGADAAKKLAAEYEKYARKGQAGPGLPIITPAATKALEGELAGALSSPEGDAAVVASAFSKGIKLFWMSPPITFVGGPASGVVTEMPGAPGVVSPIKGALSNTGNTEDQIGQQIASALDSATKTVLVTYSTPQPTPPSPATVM